MPDYNVDGVTCVASIVKGPDNDWALVYGADATVKLIRYPFGGASQVIALNGDTSGNLTAAKGFTITTGGLTVTAGGVTVTAGGVGVTAGGLTVTAGTTDIKDALVTESTVSSSQTLASQTLENDLYALTYTTDSTFLTGTNISYSGGRGSAAEKISGTWSAATGGYSNLYSIVTASGALNDANGGPIGIKSVVATSAAQTAAAGIYGLQGIAKHNHGTNKAANAAPYIGVEGVVTQSTAGQIGTAIGISAAYHIPADAAVFDGGAVWRGLQITCDNSSGNNPSEQSGVAVWNMAGAQTNVLKVINSGTGFTYFADLPDDSAPGHVLVNKTTQVNNVVGSIKVIIGAQVGYINVHSAEAA